MHQSQLALTLDFDLRWQRMAILEAAYMVIKLGSNNFKEIVMDPADGFT